MPISLRMRNFVRKIVLSGLVAAAALLGCAGPAFAGTGTTGTAPTGTSGTVTASAAIAKAVAGTSPAARIAASYLERLSAAQPQASGGGFFATGGGGISCASRAACLSVGASIDLSGSSAGSITPVVDRLQAGTWKSVPVKSPKGAPFTLLTGVSCEGATYCLVVGETASTAGNDAGGFAPYVLTWNGTTLTPIAAPPVPTADAMGVI